MKIEYIQKDQIYKYTLLSHGNLLFIFIVV